MRTSSFLLLFFVVLQSAAAVDPVVTTSNGKVRGVIEDGVRIFRGIPYAAPPEGDLRWRAPQPASAWRGMLDASRYGPVCPQMRPTQREESEDCLTLNVWTPETVDEPAPVMVWIHGGANVNGSGRTEGRSFAEEGVVLVSINYRLGRFGVFAHPELTDSRPQNEPTGNFGLMDQIAALAWVQREIAAFGGDPDRVTIFGVSAGGSSVNMLMVSPLAEGLFHRAISQSGANGMTRARRLEDVERFGRALEEHHNVDGIEGLRSLPWRDLVTQDAAYRAETNMFIDGTTVLENVGEAFAAGRQKNVPYIAGANSYEGSLAAAIPIPAFQRIMQENIDNVTRVYGMKADDPALFLSFYGDILFVAPTRYLVQNMDTVPAPAWMYHFDYVLESLDAHVPGARHGGEVAFVFDRLSPLSVDGAGARRFGLPPGEYGVNARDLEIAEMVQDYWIQFASTGSPNRRDAAVWPAYDRLNQPALVFSNEGVDVRTDIRSEMLDLLEAGYQASN